MIFNYYSFIEIVASICLNNAKQLLKHASTTVVTHTPLGVELSVVNYTHTATSSVRTVGWLQQHSLTLKGGMNLNRAPWNLPALRALIEMTQALQTSEQTLGGVHGNGGLGYKQGFAILRRNA